MRILLNLVVCLDFHADVVRNCDAFFSFLF